MQVSKAVVIALGHINAWSRHDWEKTREQLSPDIHALVTNTQPDFARIAEFSGAEEYMTRKMKSAQLIEPGSVQVISTFGDEKHAMILITFKIGLGPGGAMTTMARCCLYSLDESEKIKEERDQFLVLS
jgi:hypothetical protein